MTDYKKFLYRKNYNISTHDYLVFVRNVPAMEKYLKEHGIQNDGGYLFGDCVRFVVKTNAVHDGIIRKKFAFA